MSCPGDVNCLRITTSFVTCGCCGSNTEPPRSHRRERINIGPETNEIVVGVNRVGAIGAEQMSDVTLIIRRFDCCSEDEAELIPYAIDGSKVHFDLSDTTFITDAETFPKGFYIGSLYFGDCLLDEIEIIKAPSFFISSAKKIADKCSDEGTGYVEPDCVTVDVECESDCDEDDCRPLCEPKIVTSTKNKFVSDPIPMLGDSEDE